MVQQFCCGYPPIRVDLKNLFEHVTHFLIANFSWDGSEFPTLDFAEQVCLELSEERQFAYQDDVENDSTGPYVRCRAVVRNFSHQIWIHVVRCATVDAQSVVVSSFETEAEINYLNLLCVYVHQDVVQLQISVCVPLGVHVG